MGKVKTSPGAGEITGKVGGMVYRRLWGGVFVHGVPDFSDRQLSEKQQGENNKLKLAGIIWKALDLTAKAVYTAKGKELNKPPFGLFYKDYYHPPTVQEIDLSQYMGQAGQIIRIRATAAIALARVEVTIRQTDGKVIESGQAAKPADKSAPWTYPATLAVEHAAGLIVEVTAVNWPGKSDARIQIVPGTGS
jgi:hypothetical protein